MNKTLKTYLLNFWFQNRMKMFLFPRKIKGKLTNLIWEWKVEKEAEGRKDH